MFRHRTILSIIVTNVFFLFIFLFSAAYHVAALTEGSPTSPSNVKAIAYTSSQPRVVISWNQAMDNIGVTRYNIYKNGTFLTSLSGVGTTYTDINVTSGQSYTYSIQAGDGDGNNSAQSDTVLILVTEGATSQVTLPPTQTSDPAPPSVSVPQTVVYSSGSYDNQTRGITPPEGIGLTSFENQLRITWKNPKISQFRSARVIKKTNSFPIGTNDGTIICDGVKEECIDRNVVPKTIYYYGVYSVDQLFITSKMVTLSGSLVEEIKVTATTPPNYPEARPRGNFISTMSTVSFTKTLKLGSTGSEVLLLQKFLNNNGFSIATTGLGSAGNETTLFGPATEKSLKAYQCSKKIVCDGTPSSTGYGTVGKTTRGYLNK